MAALPRGERQELTTNRRTLRKDSRPIFPSPFFIPAKRFASPFSHRGAGAGVFTGREFGFSGMMDMLRMSVSRQQRAFASFFPGDAHAADPVEEIPSSRGSLPA